MFRSRLKEDISAILARDPAARTSLEVLLCYPGVHALIGYRLSHWLWKKNLKLLARFISHVAKILSGAEIHPGAVIGRRVFIDHATGLVIGETAEVGDDVTLYHGVTLGGISLEKGKRHPTLGNSVIVGSGAQILGPITIHDGARIGANAVVLTDVPPGITMVGIPAKAAAPKTSPAPDAFCAYGVSRTDLPDPIAQTLDRLDDQIATLTQRIAYLETHSGKTVPSPDHSFPKATDAKRMSQTPRTRRHTKRSANKETKA